MTFTRNIEDFTCEHCGYFVAGTGFTNHCPKCLWSKHVDKMPGDRAEKCQGLMRPDRIEGTGKAMRILHVCTICRFQKFNKVGDTDETDALIAVATTHAHKAAYGK